MWEFKFYRKLKKETYSEYKSVQTLSDNNIQRMYAIYSRYYQNTNIELFKHDLAEKTGVFVIREPLNNQIVGFSTIMERRFDVKGQQTFGFFSGDTIIEEAYWGGRALQRAMLRYVLHFKFRYFFKPVYWLLISKGFKTYLLMANNFEHHFPRADGHDAHLEPLVQAYSNSFYADYYNQETSLLNFGETYQALKPDVAPITNEMKEKNPKIAYFEKVNPTWQKGTELPCIAEIRWIFFYKEIFKILLKFRKKPKKTQHVHQENHQTDGVLDKDNDQSKAA
jgi:hypothetical protein